MKFSHLKKYSSYCLTKIFFREMCLSAVIVLSPMIYPATVHAGLFSSFLEVMTGQEASASVQNSTSSQNLQNMNLLEAAINVDPSTSTHTNSIVPVSGNALLAEISPTATILDVDDTENTQISTYTIRSGDSLSKISKMFGVSVNTIIWANDLGSSPTLREGQTLVILPITGVRYTVKKGDTLKGIANRYKADLNEVLQYNDLTLSSTLVEGDKLIIPDVDAIVTPKPSSTALKINPVHNANGPDYPGYYARPIIGGHKSQGLHGYNGVDLAAPVGTPIYAAADGIVIASMTGGWNGGYGNYVVISHDNGTQTMYAHNSQNLVIPGQTVSKGQIIAKIGMTGKTTGPHVHFEVRGARNPF